MHKVWFDEAWEDYLFWQSQDKKTLKRINTLVKDIERGNFDGIGKPEPLKGEFRFSPIQTLLKKSSFFSFFPLDIFSVLCYN